MDWEILIEKLESDLNLFLDLLPDTYPKAVAENSHPPDRLMTALDALDKRYSQVVDEACRDYAKTGKFQTKLSHEELYLLQFRFSVAVGLCCLLGTPAKPQTEGLFESPLDHRELIEWLLIVGWQIQGRELWILREEAVARRIASQQPPPSAL